jgi:hypothetical protein
MTEIERVIIGNLTAIIAAYQKATGLSRATISKRFYGNSTFLARFKPGAKPPDIYVSSLGKVVDKFRAEWPKNADWPFLSAFFMDRKIKK